MGAGSHLDSKSLHSGEYVLAYERKPIARLERLVARMALTPETRLVDFACGNAMLLELLHQRIDHYTGVDFSEDFIAAAKGRAQRLGALNCEFHCQEIVEFCAMHEHEFDVGTSFDFSEHVLDEDFLPILVAARNALKQGGRLYLHTPNRNFFMERIRESGVILRQRPEHVAVRSLEHNIALLQTAGFTRVNATMIPHYNVLRAVHPLRHMPVVGTLFEARIFIECTR